MKQTVTIKYNGEVDDKLEESINEFFKGAPLNFRWVAQGYDFKEGIRDIAFEREK